MPHDNILDPTGNHGSGFHAELRFTVHKAWRSFEMGGSTQVAGEESGLGLRLHIIVQ